MTANNLNRYDIDNLPITKATFDGLSEENINQISTIGRMLLLQDEFQEEQTKKIIDRLDKQKEDFDKRFDAIDIRFTSIDERLLVMEKGASEREIRISILEQHDTLQYKALFGSILLAIGLLLGWFLHSFIK